jgi:hypothetical protein
MKVSGPTRLGEDRLREHLARLVAGESPSTRRPVSEASVSRSSREGHGSTSGAEIEALRLAVHQPDAVADRLERVLFADETNVAAFDALCAASTLEDAIERARPDAAALLQRLAVEEAEADADDVVRLLVAAAVQRRLVSLQAEARGAEDPTEYAPTIGWLKVTSERLWDDADSVDAAGQLVAWLVQFGQEGG